MQLQRMKIAGVGKFHPEKIMTNEDITKMVETSDEWIVQRTGIKERRIADLEKGETPSGMAHKAAEIALKNAEIDKDDIDFIMVSNTLPDTMFPSTAAHLQSKLGIKSKCACLDVNAACTGWVYGLQLANSLISTGVYKNILLVGVEMTSAFNNWQDRSTCVLFGDGAGATVLTAASEKDSSQFFQGVLGCDSSKRESLILPKGGAAGVISHDILEKREQYITMDGQTVFKSAVKTMSLHCSKILKDQGLTIDDIDWLIPHQANLRIIEAVGQMLKFPTEKVIVNVEKYANTSSASIPAAMYEAIQDGRIKRGDKILVTAFGAGLTSGAALITF
jgi:3-oxoacyl-[acyl-carrier-protein] synthase-3